MSDFIAEHPTWDFRVDASPDPSNFEREVVDLDLRYGRGNWPGLHCEAILYDYLIPMCSPAYLGCAKAADTIGRRAAYRGSIDRQC